MVQIKEAGQCHQATRADIFPEVLIFEENAIRYIACQYLCSNKFVEPKPRENKLGKG